MLDVKVSIVSKTEICIVDLHASILLVSYHGNHKYSTFHVQERLPAIFKPKPRSMFASTFEICHVSPHRFFFFFLLSIIGNEFIMSKVGKHIMTGK